MLINPIRKLIAGYVVFSFVLVGALGLIMFKGGVEDGTVSAADLIVKSYDDGNYTHIQYAIDNASTGDTVYVWAGTYFENIIVNKTITIIGNGTSNTTINGSAGNIVIDIVADWVNISGFNVVTSEIGIKLDGASNVTVKNCTVSHCDVGIEISSKETIIFQDDFSTNIGWTGYGGSTQWQRGAAKSGGGDPGSDHSFSTDNYLVGNNIGGTYPNNVFGTEWLTSPSINCSNQTNVILSFWRWLGVEYFGFDEAYISAYNGTAWNEIWSHEGGNTIRDTEWNHVFIDVSEHACNNSNFQVRFGLGPTDSSVVYWGWNIDDFKVTSFSDVDKVENNRITNNNCTKNNYGIQIRSASYNTIENNTFYLNYHYGIFLITASNNTFLDNNCSNNGESGLYFYYSDFNDIDKNTFISNAVYGIFIEYSDQNNFINNTCQESYAGIYLLSSNLNLIDNNKFKSLYEVDIYLFYSNSNTINNNTGNADLYGILSLYSDFNVINNNTFTNLFASIYDADSKKSIITNNTCTADRWGIILEWSDSAIIANNTMNNCGLYIYSGFIGNWDSHRIDKSNTVNGKPVYFWKDVSGGTVPTGAGQVIIVNSTNVIVKDQDCSNSTAGIILGFSNQIKVDNNICNYNNLEGISIQNSDFNTVTNNSLYYNDDSGIRLIGSNSNYIENNAVKLNSHGIHLRDSNENTFEKNTVISNNYNGYYFDFSNGNTIKQNNISKNSRGVFIDWGSNANKIHNNYISSNRNYGIEIESSFSWYNFVYHNNFISNKRQAIDNGSNEFNNSKMEGNYWSDYIGKDDGTGGRPKGDGIGDTQIPHSSCDFYPFIRQSGWEYPGTPILTGPVGINTNGHYAIGWNNNPRTTHYILEEDTNKTFDSPTELYSGTELAYEVKGKDNGTYYYRLQAFNGTRVGNWSNTLEVIVDFLPDLPRDLTVSVYPGGNALNVTWKTNTVDTKEYKLYYNSGDTWEELATIVHPGYSYNHTDLTDGTRYFYRLKAFDFRTQFSDFTDSVNAVPADTQAPAPPTDLLATAVSGDEIKLEWTPPADTDIEGYMIYMNKTGNGPAGDFDLIFNMEDPNNVFIVTGLDEQITYYFRIIAYDEVPNNSTSSGTASATTPDETPPAVPTGLVVTDPTHDSLTIRWDANIEPDVVGYVLYKRASLTGKFNPVFDSPTNVTHYLDTGLKETKTYYYMIKAVDHVGLESENSTVVSGRTLLGPRSPGVNISVDDFVIPEDSYDDSRINLYEWFEDPNNDPLKFSCTGQKNIFVKIFQENGTVVLQPKHNWNGQEVLTFYASDGIYNFTDDVMITIKPVNDPPGPAEITSPQDGIEIKEGKLLDFSGLCSDPDVVYGDALVFQWSSNRTYNFGEGRDITDISLPVGTHLITLEVSDINGKKSETTITVTVLKDTEDQQPVTQKPGDKEQQETDNNLYIILGIVAIVIVIVVIVIFMKVSKDKKRKEAAKKEKAVAMQTQVPAALGPPGMGQVQFPQQVQVGNVPMQMYGTQQQYPQMPVMTAGQQPQMYDMQQPQVVLPSAPVKPAEAQLVQPKSAKIEKSGKKAQVDTEYEIAGYTKPVQKQ